MTAERHRLVRGSLLVAAAVGAAAYGFLGRSGSGPSTVVPRRPRALAVGPRGVLYSSDTARNQILARLPDGSFHVVAGTGRRGFSGDGSPAVDAALDGPGGMTVGRGGTLYDLATRSVADGREKLRHRRRGARPRPAPPGRRRRQARREAEDA